MFDCIQYTSPLTNIWSVTIRLTYHVTQSNIWVIWKLLDQWVVMCGEQCPTGDISRQFLYYRACDSCSIICSCSSTCVNKNMLFTRNWKSTCWRWDLTSSYESLSKGLVVLLWIHFHALNINFPGFCWNHKTTLKLLHCPNEKKWNHSTVEPV